MSILNKIKLKFKDYFLDYFIKFSLLINNPRLTAVGFWLAQSKVNQNGEFTVWCIGRSAFTDDIKAMSELSSRIKYVVIHLKYLDYILCHFILAQEKSQITEANYHSRPFGESGKKKVNDYLTKMMPYLKKYLGFDAVMSGNFGYVQQQELAKVCQKQKIPFIILHKEGLTVGIFKGSENLYDGCTFIGDKILVYNSNVPKALLGVNQTIGLDKDKVEVIGIPRLDYYSTVQKDLKSKKITFFSFYPKYRLSRLFKDNQEKYQAGEKRCNEFFLWVMNFAKNHPDFEVIIKTKAADYYLQYALDVFQANFKEKIPNLTITNAGDPKELILSSRVIIASNSTVLVEGLIAGKVLISPYFGDLVPDEAWDYFAQYPDLINYPRTEGELADFILKPEQYVSKNFDRREEFLKQLMYLPDGKASIRAEETIIKTIKQIKDGQA